MEFRVLGPVEANDGSHILDLGGPLERALLARLLLTPGRAVSLPQLVDDLWEGEPPESAAVSVRVRVSRLRKALGAAGDTGAAIRTEASGYAMQLGEADSVDVVEFESLARRGRAALKTGSPADAARLLGEALALWRGPALAGLDDAPFARAEAARLEEQRIGVLGDCVDARLAAGEHAELLAELDSLCTRHPLHERFWAQRMTALYRCGRQGDALAAYRQLRELLRDELSIDPSPELSALEARILHQDAALAAPTSVRAPVALPSGVVTFLLTDIEDSTALWDSHRTAMATALQRHDQLIAAAVDAHAGCVVKSKGEGDSTLSVFRRASDAMAAALDLQRALTAERWPGNIEVRVRMALHTGEAHERDGDYFGPAVNRAARLRSLADGSQILLSQAAAEVIRDHLPDTAAVRSLGERQLRGMSRAEHVFELSSNAAGDARDASDADGPAAPIDRPHLPPLLSGRGPFVGRDTELGRLAQEWATATGGTARAVLIAGEPGVGKTRLAAEWARQAYDQGALVLYGRCDEELGAPYQPFAEALHTLAPRVGARRLRSVRGVEQLVRLAPELRDVLPDLATPTDADPDTERSLLFEALGRLLGAVSVELPVVVMIDDLHWAAKPTLLLLRHLLRSADGTRLQILGTYRSTDLDRTHPLAGILADLHRDGTALRITLGGLGTDDVGAYLSAAGYRDTRLVHALSNVTSGNPFFLIEVLHHLEETGGRWDPNTLPQGVREAVGRRLSRLSDAANETLLVGAVAGSQFSLELVEHVLERDLIAPIEEARRAGLVVEETGNCFRFNHALVRQSLLSEVASVRRVRLHQRIAAALEAAPTAGGDARLAELARHWFECAFAGGAAKAVDYSRRAGEQAMSRLAYEEAAVLYDMALQAADVEGSACTDDERAELLLARCEALLAAGDPTAAVAVVEQLHRAARSSPRLSAWATCYAAQVAALTDPGRLDAITADVAAAGQRFAELGDAEGEAKAHTVRAGCLARLGRVADCEAALDLALTAARRAGHPRRVNAVLAGAPLAALWGPSPIARASGRCLDVVRVLRITTGSPAVEAVALRCQAVLEALRGRTDAARRMLASARRSLEGVGHTHGLFETDVFAGMVELIAGAPADAETSLRRAYDGFVARGVGVDAAQAAALLARAVLAEGRVDEAIALTSESERMAGVDLKAGIAWRAARAEALAQQGDLDRALDAARTAVGMADPTDALIDQADAHLSLALVLRAGGHDIEADREAQRAAELYQRKGASTRVAAVGAVAASRPSSLGDAEREPARSVRHNLATRALLSGPLDAEWVAARAERIHEDFTGTDHRWHVSMDRAALLETWRRMGSSGRAMMELTPLASMGERHCLVRASWRSGDADGATASGPAEQDWLSVIRTDADGRVVRSEEFDPDDIPGAMARLIEMHAEDELPPDRLAGRFNLAALARAKRPSWAEDAILVDHRPLGVGVLHGRDAMRAAMSTLSDVGGEMNHHAVDVLGCNERGLLIQYVTAGRTEAGEPFEIPITWLTQQDVDGRTVRAEWFAPEQLDQALERFDELTGVSIMPPRRRVRPNLATATFQSLAGIPDVPRRVAAFREDYVDVDHRTKITAGHREMETTHRALATSRRVEIEYELLASLGQRHALARCAWHVHGARFGDALMERADMVFLEVMRVHGDGRVARLERFEADDLRSAIARFIELHADDELPPERRRCALHVAEQARSGDIVWREDATLVDHRTVGLGTLHGVEAIRKAGRALHDLGAQATLRIVDVLGLAERIYATERVWEARVDGGAVELPAISVAEFDDDGRVRRAEWYDPEQRDEALSRFDELVAQAPVASLTNRAVTVRRQLFDAEFARDWNAAAALIAPDAVVDDRRALVGSRAVGREATLGFLQSMADVGVTQVDATTIATRGDRLSLTHATFSGATAESVTIGLGEITEDGRWLGVTVFDVSDLDAAFEELDARYLAGEAAGDAQWLAPILGFFPAYNRRDWPRCRKVIADDVTVIDHRPPPSIYDNVHTADELVSAVKAMVDLSPDSRARVLTIHAMAPQAAVVQVRNTGSTTDGVEFELSYCAVSVTSMGVGSHVEIFADDQLDAALARFAELRARTASVEPDYLHNAATRLSETLRDCFCRRDWDGYRAHLSEGVVADDRRAIVGVSGDGPDAVLALYRGAADIGVAKIRATTLATRGDRLVLQRLLFSAEAEDSEVEVLSVLETDEHGLHLVAVVGFDPDDLDGAYDELDARYRSGEGAPYAAQLEVAARLGAAYNARDWATFTGLLADDMTLEDHRPAGWGRLDRAQYVATLAGLVELAPDVRVHAVAILHHADSGLAGIFHFSGTDTFGGAFEIDVAGMLTMGSSGVATEELFAESDRELAVRRLSELAPLAAS